MECPYCGGSGSFIGMDDGGGDYGDSVVELWRCVDCHETFDRDWSATYDDNGDAISLAWREPVEFDDDPALFDTVRSASEDFSLTPRQRIERAVAAVCEVAASIRSRLTGREELPF